MSKPMVATTVHSQLQPVALVEQVRPTIELLSSHCLSPMANSITRSARQVRFIGEFLQIEHSFSIVLPDDVSGELLDAFFANRSRDDYIKLCDDAYFEHRQVLDELTLRRADTIEAVRLWTKRGPRRADFSRELAQRYPHKGSMTLHVVEALYELREKEFEHLAKLIEIEPSDLALCDRGVRARVAADLFATCTQSTRRMLLEDEHPHVRSCAAASRMHVRDLA